MGSIDTARRLLYGAAAGAAVLVTGENAEGQESKPMTPAVENRTVEDGERFRELVQRIVERNRSPEEVAESAARERETEQLVERTQTADVAELIRLLDSKYFRVREKATERMLLMGAAVGEINPKDKTYSPEQRLRLRIVARNLQVIEDSKRWKGTSFRLPEGWKEGEQRTFSEIIRQLRRDGGTGITTEHAQAATLRSHCRVPRDGTPFWEVYQSLRGTSEKGCSLNTASAGVLYVGNAACTEEFTASDGALFAEMERKSPTRVGVFFYTEGTMQLGYWKCTGARAVYPNGSSAELTADEGEGSQDDTLYLDLPESTEGNVPDIELRLSCEAWPIRTKEVTDFALKERQETPDGGLRFLEVREEEIAEKGQIIKVHNVFTMDMHGITFDPEQAYCPMDFSGIEAFDTEGNALDGGYSYTHSETGHTRKPFTKLPARVLLRSVDLNARAVADKSLKFRGVDLREKEQK